MNGLTPAAAVALAQGLSPQGLTEDAVNNFIAAVTPGGIERQEAEGQRALANSFDKLPIEMDHEQSVAHGFVIGEAVDEVFVSVTAPEGWRLVPTEHSMWSDIVNGEGQKRGEVFYKAAFYDRRAQGDWIK